MLFCELPKDTASRRLSLEPACPPQGGWAFTVASLQEGGHLGSTVGWQGSRGPERGGDMPAVPQPRPTASDT